MKQIKILITDDHNIVRASTKRILEMEDDFTVVGEARNGEEAVVLTEQLKPDVVVMDIAMPVMDGIVATKRIKKYYPSTAVLILTNYDDNQFVRELLKSGISGYLLKSVHNNELVEAIRSVSAGKLTLHPSVAIKVKDLT